MNLLLRIFYPAICSDYYNFVYHFSRIQYDDAVPVKMSSCPTDDYESGETISCMIDTNNSRDVSTDRKTGGVGNLPSDGRISINSLNNSSSSEHPTIDKSKNRREEKAVKNESLRSNKSDGKDKGVQIDWSVRMANMKRSVHLEIRCYSIHLYLCYLLGCYYTFFT